MAAVAFSMIRTLQDLRDTVRAEVVKNQPVAGSLCRSGDTYTPWQATLDVVRLLKPEQKEALVVEVMRQHSDQPKGDFGIDGDTIGAAFSYMLMEITVRDLQADAKLNELIRQRVSAPT